LLGNRGQICLLSRVLSACLWRAQVAVYATNEAGNTGTSETIFFTAAKPEPFQQHWFLQPLWLPSWWSALVYCHTSRNANVNCAAYSSEGLEFALEGTTILSGFGSITSKPLFAFRGPNEAETLRLDLFWLIKVEKSSKSAGSGIRTHAAPRGHKLLGALVHLQACSLPG
jgi:hypothetical protein